MDQYLNLVENPKKFEAALKAVKKEMSDKQYGDLITLANTKGGVEATRDAGGRVRGETVFSCGKIGAMLTKHCGGLGPEFAMSWIGHIKQKADGTEQWVMHQHVQAAVKALDWV